MRLERLAMAVGCSLCLASSWIGAEPSNLESAASGSGEQFQISAVSLGPRAKYMQGLMDLAGYQSDINRMGEGSQEFLVRSCGNAKCDEPQTASLRAAFMKADSAWRVLERWKAAAKDKLESQTITDQDLQTLREQRQVANDAWLEVLFDCELGQKSNCGGSLMQPPHGMQGSRGKYMKELLALDGVVSGLLDIRSNSRALIRACDDVQCEKPKVRHLTLAIDKVGSAYDVIDSGSARRKPS